MTPTRSQPIFLAVCVAGLVSLASPLGRQFLEASLVTHMLVQMPLLVFIGMGFGRISSAAAAPYVATWNRGGSTGLLLTLGVAMFWMLPRAMDAALVDMRFEAAKFVSLPVAGVALAWSYGQASPIVKGVLNAHVVSALGVMGWAYMAAPVRLCNAYLASDQEMAGAGLLAAGAVTAAYFAMRIVFFGATRSRYIRTSSASDDASIVAY
ncbi:MAG: hypothetical protein J0H65_09535 [Rhizobiales bacterium]|nr:hypothetical protein [Hyphomicrobiales bacterium]